MSDRAVGRIWGQDELFPKLAKFYQGLLDSGIAVKSAGKALGLLTTYQHNLLMNMAIHADWSVGFFLDLTFYEGDGWTMPFVYNRLMLRAKFVEECALVDGLHPAINAVADKVATAEGNHAGTVQHSTRVQFLSKRATDRTKKAGAYYKKMYVRRPDGSPAADDT
jgi:hypothetical protein